MSEEILEIIQKLIDEGKGDLGRLNHILESVKMGKILYKSDARYLDQLIANQPKKEEVLNKNFEPQKGIDETKEKIEVKEQKSEVPEKPLNEIQAEIAKISSNYKSAGVTVILSIILGAVGLLGIGHFYLRKNGRGIGFLVSGFILSILSFVILLPIYGTIEGFASQLEIISLALGIPLAYIVLYFWQIVDSYKQCKKYNYQLSIK